jgi:hypothetical protein
MVCTRLICFFLRRGERPPSPNSFDFVDRLNIDADIVTKIEISPGTPFRFIPYEKFSEIIDLKEHTRWPPTTPELRGATISLSNSTLIEIGL